MKAVLLAGELVMVYRHPFLGPGLGVRILGEVKSEFSDLLRREAIDLCSFYSYKYSYTKL